MIRYGDKDHIGGIGLKEETGFFPVLATGLLSGILIWAVVLAGDVFVDSIGRADLRTVAFPVALLVWMPLLLALCGGVSEIVRIRREGSEWDPWRPYLSGLIAGSTALSLTALDSGLRQYVPLNEPGLFPGLGFAFGRVIVHLLNPVSFLLIGLLAVFALGGGYLVVRISGK